MKNLYLLFTALLFCINIVSFAQNDSRNFWKDINESQLLKSGQMLITPKIYRSVVLDYESLKNFLKLAPTDNNEKKRLTNMILSLPMPDGTAQRFIIYESPVMAPELSAKYPLIKTYAGQGIDDQYASLRFDFTPHGFHAIILSPNGRVFIDPRNKDDVENYISYYTKYFIKSEASFDCEIKFEENRLNQLELMKQKNQTTSTGPQLRVYKLAVAATGEYTTFHGGTVPLALAAIVTSINRVDAIYESEIAVRMVLVANEDTLIFTNSTKDPYTNDNGDAMLQQNQTTVDSLIGSNNYDIGHVFSTGGGGIAYLGVICYDGYKAQGVTGSSSPIGDPFDIDYVAHEMGHQFGGDHSFNGSSGNCSGGNRNPSTAYEPGSGSTIMAYAGICSPQNLQFSSDPYFHTISFDQIIAYTSLDYGNNCAQIISTGNNAPIVTAPAGGFFIPKSTPFSLTGSAIDPNGDPLTYCWEEFDLGPAGAPAAPSGNAPIFRSWNPTTSSTRYFPRLQNLLNNTSVIGEILPAYSRILTFRLTARDNKVGGGGVNYSQVLFNVDGNAGPFLVTSPNTNIAWSIYSVQTIMWDVANTSASEVNCANVNILLSTDGGQTFPTVLASSTPNDGSESITVPNITTSQARIKVEAVGNIFFDLSNVNFTIEEVVPVELVSFTAERTEFGVELNWETATETNNSGFNIERSRDGEQYNQIGFVNGKGTITEPSIYGYIDNNIEVGKYYYRLKQIDYDGSFKYLNDIMIDIGLPKQFVLNQNHPNPFNPTTTIKFQLPVDANVRIDLYNVLGQKVSELLNSNLSGGVHEITFEGSSVSGGLSSGIYYYTMNAIGKDGINFTSTKKMILMK